MTTNSRRPSALPVARGITNVYRWGSLVSGIVIVLGILVAIIRQEPLATELGAPADVFGQALRGHANGIIGVGILIMILTPLCGAALMTRNYFRIGDRRFGFIGGAIVLVLLTSIAASLI